MTPSMAAETLFKGYKLASAGLPRGLLIARQKPLGEASAVIILLTALILWWLWRRSNRYSRA